MALILRFISRKEDRFPKSTESTGHDLNLIMFHDKYNIVSCRCTFLFVNVFKTGFHFLL